MVAVAEAIKDKKIILKTTYATLEGEAKSVAERFGDIEMQAFPQKEGLLETWEEESEDEHEASDGEGVFVPIPTGVTVDTPPQKTASAGSEKPLSSRVAALKSGGLEKSSGNLSRSKLNETSIELSPLTDALNAKHPGLSKRLKDYRLGEIVDAMIEDPD